jgi:hypothetical protein
MVTNPSTKSNRQRRKPILAQATAAACLLLVSTFGGQVLAAQKAATKTTTELPTYDVPPLARNMPTERVAEVVIVWGFRWRPTEHDLRVASIRSGYGELIDKPACLTQVCGFVVAKEGDKWQATNVIAATEAQLADMQRAMERQGTTLVIVHPTGEKRRIPEF